MSDQNVPQQWKRDPCEANGGSNNFYPKPEVVTGRVEQSSSSSFSISSRSSNTSGELYQVQQQPQLQHHDLHKFSNISKINTLAKIGVFEGVTQMPEDEKLRKVQQIVEAGVGDHAKQQILQILDKISLLKPPERLLLYLRMPGGSPETDPLRQPQNPLGTRCEINHTINWVRSHLEHDPKVSIPKQDVYNDYIAYCERVDIKPLSTADFGKVMKQVFPEIRPRRLGTRGHSRYCYAAMRKTTKLDPPCLPSLDAKANAFDFNGAMDEESWKIIKMWAEGLLNSNFNSLKDLATHIMRHHLNTPASNSSRLLLQKKLLQREIREKRKYADASPLKRRRKKKRRTSSSSESTPQHSTMMPDGALVNVKKEILGPIQQQLTVQIQTPVTTLQQPKQLMPMNLVTDQDTNNLHKIQGTNLGCDNNLVVDCATKALVASSISSVCPVLIKDSTEMTSLPENLTKRPFVKEEIPDDYNSNVLCKKVRRAQEAKGLWNSSQPGSNHSDSQQFNISSEHSSEVPNYPRVNENILRPSAHVEMTGNTSNAQSKSHSAVSIHLVHPPAKSESSIMLRARKLRYLQAKLESVREEQAASEVDPEKDVLPENLGIPRERVISICNMDKHELDDYLNGEDNSQDQEAELLQYFQPEESGQKTSGNEVAGEINVDSTSISLSGASISHNFTCNRGEKRSLLSKDHDEITQLRHYLQQNLQSKKEIDSSINHVPSIEQSTSYSGIYTAGSASASLALMSQRHLSDDVRCCNINHESGNPCGANSNNSALRGFRRKVNLNIRSGVPNSPNTRRKNFNFMPISPNANTPNNSVNYSPFVSPRSTPVVRKPPLHKQQSLPIADQSIADPMISATRASYNKSGNLNVISASAPPSPSLVQQRFHFIPTTSAAIVSHSREVDHQFNHFQAVAIHCRNQNIVENSTDGLVESRSQSVPLHCQSPIFNQASNFAGFSSACSSVAQTPVPPEFADFSDPSTILDIFSEGSQQNTVKLENSDVSSTLLDVDITSSESVICINESLSSEFDSKTNPISRSVPNTPLPMLNFNKTKGSNSVNRNPSRINKIYDMSKSVPTTPIAMNATPFRYSPEFNRDFLINGNTVESAGAISYYNQQQQVPANLSGVPVDKTSVAQTNTLPETIDDLSNFVDVTESIMGSDLLGSL